MLESTEVAAIRRALKAAPSTVDLNDSVVYELASAATFRVYEKNEYIFREGDLPDVFMIVAGGCARTLKHSRRGADVTISLRLPGSTFGSVVLLEDRPLPVSFQALSRTSTVNIPKKSYISLVRKHPELAMMVIHELGRHVRDLTEVVFELSASKVQGRVTRTLYRLAEEYGAVLPLTHQQVADIAGTSRETASRALERLQEKGIVRSERGTLVLLDRSRLRRRLRG